MQFSSFSRNVLSLVSISLLVFLSFLPVTVKAETYHVAVTSNVFTPASITINVGDTIVWTNTQGNHNVNGAQSYFPSNPESFGNGLGYNWTYSYVFTLPGTYDYQCDPHVGIGMIGKVIVEEPLTSHTLTVNLSNMDDYAGKEFFLRITDDSNGEETARVTSVISPSFALEIPGIMLFGNYTVDFFADSNGNGIYDAPPVDAAWSVDLLNITGDEIINFPADDKFTDIGWKYKLSMNFSEMAPAEGLMFSLFIRDLSTGETIDSQIIESVAGPGFDLYSYTVIPGGSYQLDFFSDLNFSGTYNHPPTDEAWRVELQDIKGDTLVNFIYNNQYTDIFPLSGIANLPFVAGVYPNPAMDVLTVSLSERGSVGAAIYSVTGKLLLRETFPQNNGKISLDVSSLSPGIYFLEMKSELHSATTRFVKE